MAVRLIRIEQGAEAADVQMQWSSIFGGAFLTLGFGVFFLLLGNAIGLNVLNTIRPAVGGALKFWSWIYIAATLVFSYFLGGFLSTRSTKVETPSSGLVHGLVSWGLSSIVVVGIGAFSSVGVRNVLAGVGTDASNWLAICIVGLGGFFAALGGMAGKYSKHEIMRTETREAA